MIFILTSTDNILSVSARPQESRIGDSNVEGVLSLKLKKSLTAEAYLEQSRYLQDSATAAYVSLNKLDQRNRFRSGISLEPLNNESFNFTQGSSSSGLGYALACFDVWWRISLNKKGKFKLPIFATGEVLTSGKVRAVGHITEKLESTLKYVNRNFQDKDQFIICYPLDNDNEIPSLLRKRILNSGGVLVPTERLQHTLGELLNDNYDGDPLNRWQPFKGLQSFNYEDSVRFFGRELDVLNLYSSITESDGITLVTGLSGSGKSSMVQAGLIPFLEQKIDTFFWRCTTVHSINIIDFVLASISDAWDLDIELLKSMHQGIQEDFVEFIADKSVNKSTNIFLCFDQLESVFYDESEFNTSDWQLIQRLNKEIATIDIVCCLNSEYLDPLLTSAVFSSLNIFQLSGDIPFYNLNEIITKQAHFSGIKFEINKDGISLDKIISEEVLLIKHPLSLVSYLLELLHQRALENNSDTIKFEYSKSLGGVKGACVALINSIVEKNDFNRENLPSLLELFVGVDNSGNAMFNNVDSAHPHISKIEPLIDDLKRAHLILAEINTETKAKHYYFAHSFLLQKWPMINEFKEKHLSFIVWFRLHEKTYLKWLADLEIANVNCLQSEKKLKSSFNDGYAEYRRNLIRGRNLLSYTQLLNIMKFSDVSSNEDIGKYLRSSFLNIGAKLLKNTVFVFVLLWLAK